MGIERLDAAALCLAERIRLHSAYNKNTNTIIITTISTNTMLIWDGERKITAKLSSLRLPKLNVRVSSFPVIFVFYYRDKG